MSAVLGVRIQAYAVCGNAPGSLPSPYAQSLHSHSAHRSTTGKGVSARVLVVDDEAQLRLAVKRSFEGHGYKVHAADDAASALLTHDAFKPDVVLIDIDLPDHGPRLVLSYVIHVKCDRIRQAIA